MAKKRKITPQHLAALRAAGKKRRGKKRGPYKTPIEKILKSAKAGTLLEGAIMHRYTDDNSLREKAVEAAIKVYLNDEGRNGSTTSLPFLKFVHDLFLYVKDGGLPQPQSTEPKV